LEALLEGCGNRKQAEDNMESTFSPFNNYSIARARLDESQVLGEGGPAAPRLSLPLRLDISHGDLKQNEGIQIVSLQGRLQAQNGLVVHSQAEPLDFILRPEYHSEPDRLCYLGFSLNLAQIDWLERLRDGGDVKFHFQATLSTNKLAVLKADGSEWHSRVVWGHVHGHRLFLQTEIKIPRDVWISRVLPNVGYGVIHLLEFPAIPMENCKALEHSFKALQQAQEHHRRGLYDDAVGRCRVALEHFFEHEEKIDGEGVTRRVPVLRRDWATKLGESTYRWLNDTTGAVKHATNLAHHSADAHYSQADSQMIIAITMATVAFVARTMGEEAVPKSRRSGKGKPK
jgi:hypothetical protein